MSIKKKCAKVGCNCLIELNSKYCDKHKKEDIIRDIKYRGNSSERGYDNSWRKIRIKKLVDCSVCEYCRYKNDILVRAELVHHCDLDSSNNNDNNLLSLCVNCHGELHGLESKNKKEYKEVIKRIKNKSNEYN